MPEAMQAEYVDEDPSAEELGQLRGSWVAVVGRKIVASGDDPEQVLDAAEKASPGRQPMIYRVPTGEVMIL
jgi:hypothetical protein